MKLNRLLFSLLVAAIGLALLLASIGGFLGSEALKSLVLNVGLAFLVAGIASTFHEAVLRHLEGQELAIQVATKVRDMLAAAPPLATGIRLVAPSRIDYAGYYSWVLQSGEQDMFFGGRSVLHRIDADLRKKGKQRVEEELVRRLREGARIKVLFLDPRSDAIDRLAREERQTQGQLLADLAVSIGVCVRLHEILRDTRLPPAAQLEVRVFDEIPYFAFHRVDDHMIIGFYFRRELGLKSPAYEVVDAETKGYFSQHFDSLFARSADSFILRIDAHRGVSELNRPFVETLRSSLAVALDKEVVDKLIAEGRSG